LHQGALFERPFLLVIGGKAGLERSLSALLSIWSIFLPVLTDKHRLERLNTEERLYKQLGTHSDELESGLMGNLNAVNNIRRNLALLVLMPILVSMVFFDGGVLTAAGADPLTGKFIGPDTTMTIEQAKAKGAYSGVIELKGQKFPFTASARSGSLTGQFKYKDVSFDFSAQLVIDVMTFKTITKNGTRTIVLKRVKPKVGNPFVEAPSATGNPFAPGANAIKVTPAVHPLEGQWAKGWRTILIADNMMTLVEKDSAIKQTGRIVIKGGRITIFFKNQPVTLSYHIKGDVLTFVDGTGFTETYKRIGKGTTGASNVRAVSAAPHAGKTSPTPKKPEENNFSGTFTGKFLNDPVTIKLQLVDKKVSGTVSGSDRVYKVQGLANANGNTAELLVFDLVSGVEVPFNATVDSKSLTFNWALTGQTKGRTSILRPMIFTRQKPGYRRTSRKPDKK